MPEGIIPPWMEDVANAGSFEEHAKMKEQKELLEAMEKIPVEKFRNMKDMLTKVESLFNVAGGSDLSLLSGIGDSITDTIQTEFAAITAELKNEINSGINKALEPILPAIQVLINGLAAGIGLGFSAWAALFTGKWADFEKRLESIFPGITKAKEDFLVGFSEFLVNFGLQFDPATTLLYQDLEASAAAGGTYSGFFGYDTLNIDVSPEAIAALLANLNLPTYEEE